jgi:hypothetical protein
MWWRPWSDFGGLDPTLAAFDGYDLDFREMTLGSRVLFTVIPPLLK